MTIEDEMSTVRQPLRQLSPSDLIRGSMAEDAPGVGVDAPPTNVGLRQRGSSPAMTIEDEMSAVRQLLRQLSPSDLIRGSMAEDAPGVGVDAPPTNVGLRQRGSSPAMTIEDEMSAVRQLLRQLSPSDLI